jgi:hypothetical protein
MDFQTIVLILLMIAMIIYFFIILNSINSDIDDDTDLKRGKQG